MRDRVLENGRNLAERRIQFRFYMLDVDGDRLCQGVEGGTFSVERVRRVVVRLSRLLHEREGPEIDAPLSKVNRRFV